MRTNDSPTSSSGTTSAPSAPSNVSSSSPASTSTPVSSGNTSGVRSAQPSQISDDPNGPVTIFPSSRADAREMAQRVKRRTGRDVVVAEGYPGLEEPTAGQPIVPLTGDAQRDAEAAGVRSRTTK